MVMMMASIDKDKGKNKVTEARVTNEKIFELNLIN